MAFDDGIRVSKIFGDASRKSGALG